MSTQNLDNSILDDGGTPDDDSDDLEYTVPGVDEQKLEIGVGGRWGWNSGPTILGTGFLSGIDSKGFITK